MWIIKFNLSFPLAGCPQDGLPAIDFRKEHGLPPLPTNEHEVTFEIEDEALCRRHGEFLDQQADLNASKHYSCPKETRPLFSEPDSGVPLTYHFIDPYPIPPAVAVALVEAQSSGEGLRDAVAGLLEALDEARRADLKGREGRLAEHRAKKAEAERQEAERKAQRAREEEEKEAKAAAAREERNAWIEAHGSVRLRRLKEEKIDVEALYREERLAFDHPGWVYYADVPIWIEDAVVVPSLKDLDLLDMARCDDPGAKLEYGRERSADIPDEDDAPLWEGFLAVSHLLGEKIMYLPDGAPR